MTTTATPRVVCVTVSYNGAEDTGRLLASLATSALRVVVVDNGSTHADLAALRSACTTAAGLDVELVESPANLGFAGGVNVGIRHALDAGADWVLLLNNDTTVDGTFATELHAALAGAAPGIVAFPLEEGGATVRAGRRRWLHRETDHHPAPDGAHDAYAIGAAMAIDRATLEQVGLLDEEYFLYFEDVDYSERVRAAGRAITFASAPVVHHGVSVTTRRLGAPALARYHSRNAIRCNRLHAPAAVRALVPVWAALVALGALGRLLLGRDPARNRAVLAGVLDAWADRAGPLDPRPLLAIDCSAAVGPRWGVGRLVEELVDALARDDALARRARVALYAPAPLPVPPDGWGALEPRRVRVALPGRLGRSSLLYQLVGLPGALRRDGVAAAYLPGYLLPPGIGAPTMVMLTEDVLREAADDTLPSRQRMVLRWLGADRARRRADRVLALSEASAVALAAQGVPRERIVVDRLAVRAPAPGEAVDPATFLWVGQAFPRRHLREALLAFQALAAGTDHTFRVIGVDRYPTPTLAALVADVNRALGRHAVRWDEYVTEEELAAAYRGAGALVYVSETEAFGMPPLEALAHGAPAVVADTPVHRELLGDAAFYVAAPVTEASIGDAMRRAIADDAHRAAIVAAAPRILASLSWDEHARRVVDALLELARS